MTLHGVVGVCGKVKARPRSERRAHTNLQLTINPDRHTNTDDQQGA